jgi:hypothetical protein
MRSAPISACAARRPCDAARAKYALQHTVRTHLACEDAAYGCMGAGQDAQGLSGVFLRKNVIETASRALAENLRVLTPLVTPPLARVRPAHGSRSALVWMQRTWSASCGLLQRPWRPAHGCALVCSAAAGGPAALACPPPVLRACFLPRHEPLHVAHAGQQGRACLHLSQPCPLHACARGARSPDLRAP